MSNHFNKYLAIIHNTLPIIPGNGIILHSKVDINFLDDGGIFAPFSF